MSDINGIALFSIQGAIPRVAKEIDFKRRPGVDGEDVHDRGFHGKENSVLLVQHYATDVIRNAALLVFLSMQSAIVTATDDHTESFANLAVRTMDVELQENHKGHATPYKLVMRANLHALL